MFVYRSDYDSLVFPKVLVNLTCRFSLTSYLEKASSIIELKRVIEETLAPLILALQMTLKARLHDRKIGYGPVKKGVRTSHFRSCKLCVSCFLGWVRTRIFSGFGVIDVYGLWPRNQNKHGSVPVCSFLTAP